MKILKIQALRGPNIWSVNRKKLIQMRLDIEDLEDQPLQDGDEVQHGLALGAHGLHGEPDDQRDEQGLQHGPRGQ